MHVKYVGPDTGSQLIAATGQQVDPGEIVEVPDAVGATLAPGAWQQVKKAAKQPQTEE